MKKSLVYFQSGGPTAVINCSCFGVLEEALAAPQIDKIYGARYGVEGLLDDQLVDLRSLSQEERELLKKTPGSILGSTRKKLPDIHDPLFQKILDTIQKHQIGYILVNGGNDSMDTCHRLSQFFLENKLPVSVLGIPKTIDNDLEVTDHSLGYASAAKHIINTMSMIIEDAKAYKKGKVVLVEIMGRDTGWLTASVDLLPENRRPDLLYIPERKWDEKAFLENVQAVYAKKGYVVCAVSEGIPVRHINECGTDAFGHQSLEGCCLSLSHLIDKNLHLGSRSIELSIPERADPLLQSPIDVEEAIEAGRFALQQVLKNETGKMVCIKRVSNIPYKSAFFLENVGDIADKTKAIPAAFLGDEKRMSDAFRAYLQPLLGDDYLYPSLSLTK